MASQPTAKRRRLARTLRNLREAAGLDQHDLSDVGISQTKLSRMETASVSISPDDVRLLCERYHVEPERIERLVRLAREAKKRGWWRVYRSSLKVNFEDFLEMEADAVEFMNFETSLVPGLLQTEHYARAVVRCYRPAGDERLVDERVHIRMKRQERVFDGTLSIWAVVDATAITRVVGSREVMRDQLAHLAKVAELPNVTFQVIPADAAEHMGMGLPFAAFRFPDGDGVVAVEHLTGTLYLEDESEVDSYDRAFRYLVAAAREPRDSIALVHEQLDRLGGTV